MLRAINTVCVTLIYIYFLSRDHLLCRLPRNDKHNFFCLWLNVFQQNVKTAFRHLRKYNYFGDVTLDCEDGLQVEAHKVILAASSPFFHNLSKKKGHTPVDC